jgi:hypothetical protein
MLRFHPAAAMAVWMVMVIILLFILDLRTPVFHVAAYAGILRPGWVIGPHGVQRLIAGLLR